MTTPPSDDDLRRRVQELGRREAGAAPPWDRVWRGRQPRAVRSGLASRLRPALALAGVFLVVALAWWWPMRPDRRIAVVGLSETPSSEAAEEWELPTDGLLAETRAGAGTGEVERLSREIEGLLQP